MMDRIHRRQSYTYFNLFQSTYFNLSAFRVSAEPAVGMPTRGASDRISAHHSFILSFFSIFEFALANKIPPRNIRLSIIELYEQSNVTHATARLLTMHSIYKMSIQERVHSVWVSRAKSRSR